MYILSAMQFAEAPKQLEVEAIGSRGKYNKEKIMRVYGGIGVKLCPKHDWIKIFSF